MKIKEFLKDNLKTTIACALGALLLGGGAVAGAAEYKNQKAQEEIVQQEQEKQVAQTKKASELVKDKEEKKEEVATVPTEENITDQTETTPNDPVVTPDPVPQPTPELVPVGDYSNPVAEGNTIKPGLFFMANIKIDEIEFDGNIKVTDTKRGIQYKMLEPTRKFEVGWSGTVKFLDLGSNIVKYSE